MTRSKAILTSTISIGSSALVSAALLIGLPWTLIAFVGKPFPDTIPTSDEVSWYLTNGQFPDAFWIGLFSLVLWFVWVQLVAGFVIELVAAVRGLEPPSLPGLGFAQGLMGPLVGRVAMVISVIGTAPGVASAATVPMDAAPLSVDFAATDMAMSATGSSFASAGTATLQIVAGSADLSFIDPSASRTPGETIEVVRRDTLRSLAETHLGSAGEWSVLRDANLGRVMADGAVIDADTVMIKPGWELALPSSATAGAPGAPTQSEFARDAGDPSIVVQVEEADHFWSLAETTLTEAWGREPTDEELTPYWAEMVEANVDRLLPPDDPNLIYPGQTFVIPAVPANPDLGPSAALSADGPLEDRVTQDVAPTPTLPQPEQSTEAPATAPEGRETVAPPVAAVVSESASSGLDTERLFSSDLAKAAALATIGGLTLALAGITANRLRRRRLDRRSLAAPEQTDTPEGIAVEDQIRSISNDSEEAANYLAALNPWLSHILSPGGTVPAIIAVKAGSNGVEVLLDEPASLGDKFVAVNDEGTAWRLTSDMTDRMMKSDAGNALAYAPMLLPIGDSPSGPLLVDFERIGALSIVGDPASRDGLLRNIVCAALATPWLGDTEIVAIGVPGLHPQPGSKIVVPADPHAWAEQIAASTTRDAKQASRSPYEDRMDGLLSDGVARLVVVGPDFAGVAQHLAPVADLAWSQLALVAASEVPSEFTIVAEPKSATLEPVSLRFDVDLVDDVDLEAIDGLMTSAQAVADAGHTSDVIETPVSGPIDLGELSDATTQRIGEIMAPCGVELKVLTESPEVVGAEMTVKPTALVAYIALHPGVATTKLRKVFWDHAKNEQTSSENALTRIRRTLGATEDGTNRLPKATTLSLVDVGNDWGRFGQLVEAANTAGTPSDVMEYLDAALDLVEGCPAKQAHLRYWSWFRDDPKWYAAIELMVTEVASRRAGLALQAGDPLAARHAIRKGLTVAPESEALLMLSMNATKHIEGDEALSAEFAAAINDSEEHGYDLTPETHRFYKALVDRPSLTLTGARRGPGPIMTTEPEEVMAEVSPVIDPKHQAG